MIQPSDWQLVEAAREGRADAFAELVRRHHQAVIHFCQRMIGSVQDAEDLAQESFLRVYRHLPRLRPEARFTTVLFGVARNLTLNFIRDGKRRGRDRQEALTWEDGGQRMIAGPGLRPDCVAQLQEIDSMLELAIAQLSPEHREVLMLREMEGLDYDAIAAVVRCRAGTVKSRLARAREQLRLRLIELGGDSL